MMTAVTLDRTGHSKGTPSRLDGVIELLMILLLAFMPLALGAVEAWSEQVVIALAGAMAFVLALKLAIRPDAPFVWSWAYLPVGLFLLLAGLQLIPLPASLVELISPNTTALKNDLLGDMPQADQLLGNMTLSFYPAATRHGLLLAVAVAAVFVVVVNVYRDSGRIERLLWAVAVIGGMIAVLALIQDVFGNGKIFWIVPQARKGSSANAGSFIHHSHYGQFMNLSVGAMIGLLLVRLRRKFGHRSLTLPVVVKRLGQRDLRPVWFIAGAIVVAAVTVFLSLTRCGMIAMLIAGSLMTVMLASKRGLRGRGWIFMLLTLGAFVCVLYVGFDAVCDRLATLKEQQSYVDRLQILKDVSGAIVMFPVFGTGLGTHEVVFPMFDSSTIAGLAAHAENDYVQITEEMGFVGMGLLACFLIIIWRHYATAVRRGGPSIRIAAFGLGFGLLAVMIQSLSGFGQHVPANACLAAVCCGLLVNLARIEGRKSQATASKAGPILKKPLRWCGVFGVAVVWAWTLAVADNARCGEAHWRQAKLAEQSLMQADWRGSDDQYAQLQKHAAAAASYQPDNAKYLYSLNVYQWRSINRNDGPQTDQTLLAPAALATTKDIVNGLHEVRALCPTFGPAYCLVGQLEKFVLDDPIGDKHIRTGRTLAPCNPAACFAAALSDFQNGQVEAAVEQFRRSLRLNGRMRQRIVDLYLREVNRPDLAVAIVKDSVGGLLRIARVLQKAAAEDESAARARDEAITRLKEYCDRSEAPAGALVAVADICRQDKDDLVAIRYYRRALAQQYGRGHWHLGLARLLARTGQPRQAIHHAHICLRLQPGTTQAKKLIADISILPDVVSGN